ELAHAPNFTTAAQRCRWPHMLTCLEGVVVRLPMRRRPGASRLLQRLERQCLTPAHARSPAAAACCAGPRNAAAPRPA
ncbi:hypothetical protein HAX54_008447, partial [Datura stramonium]|nr:hypothetical protein [Datura stramonium]